MAMIRQMIRPVAILLFKNTLLNKYETTHHHPIKHTYNCEHDCYGVNIRIMIIFRFNTFDMTIKPYYMAKSYYSFWCSPFNEDMRGILWAN